MWDQVYTPVAGSLGASALVAAIPIAVMLLSLAVLRLAAWKSGTLGLATVIVISATVYGMPLPLVASATLYGAAFGLFPIAWIVFWAVALYRLTVETGQFEIIKNSVGHLTPDRRLQALFIAFAFGAFVEGASGFGTPRRGGLGDARRPRIHPVLRGRHLPAREHGPGRFWCNRRSPGHPGGCHGPPPGYPECRGRTHLRPAVLVHTHVPDPGVCRGTKGLRAVWPATVVCGVSFAVTQFLVSNYVGPYLTDILASIISLICLVLLLRVWKPRDDVAARGDSGVPAGVLLKAWSPYILLVIFVLLWGWPPVKALLDKATIVFGWPGLDGVIRRLPPVVAKAAPYPAKFTLNLLSAGGTCALFACIGTALLLRIPAGRFFATIGRTAP